MKNIEPDSDIKIFVSHRIDLESVLLKEPIYYPVRCGAIFVEHENTEIPGDDTGINISSRRMSFCELYNIGHGKMLKLIIMACATIEDI